MRYQWLETKGKTKVFVDFKCQWVGKKKIELIEAPLLEEIVIHAPLRIIFPNEQNNDMNYKKRAFTHLLYGNRSLGLALLSWIEGGQFAHWSFGLLGQALMTCIIKTPSPVVRR